MPETYGHSSSSSVGSNTIGHRVLRTTATCLNNLYHGKLIPGYAPPPIDTRSRCHVPWPCAFTFALLKKYRTFGQILLTLCLVTILIFTRPEPENIKFQPVFRRFLENLKPLENVARGDDQEIEYHVQFLSMDATGILVLGLANLFLWWIIWKAYHKYYGLKADEMSILNPPKDLRDADNNHVDTMDEVFCIDNLRDEFEEQSPIGVRIDDILKEYEIDESSDDGVEKNRPGPSGGYRPVPTRIKAQEDIKETNLRVRKSTENQIQNHESTVINPVTPQIEMKKQEPIQKLPPPPGPCLSSNFSTDDTNFPEPEPFDIDIDIESPLTIQSSTAFVPNVMQNCVVIDSTGKHIEISGRSTIPKIETESIMA